ncbi:hypothetical protein [Streptomyces fradiae]|uniref:hypothetical protein n=1 Tax=Streptomyces fradiae TaxID=1906 RepID=UPI0035190242
MAAHAAAPARRQFSTHGWGLPVLVGISYGLYAPVVVRDGGPLAWSQFWIGLISAVVLAVAIHTLHRYGRRLRRELHAVAWGALAGIALGYLVSLSGKSVFSSSMLGLITCGVVTAATFYTFYTHEDAVGRPAPY